MPPPTSIQNAGSNPTGAPSSEFKVRPGFVDGAHPVLVEPSAPPSVFVSKWLECAQACFDARDVHGFVDLFEDGGYWRDILTLELDFNALKKDTIEPYLSQHKLTLPSLKKLTIDRPEGLILGQDGLIKSFIKFETDSYRGNGFLQLRTPNSRSPLKAFIFFTQLWEVKGHEEPLGPRRPLGTPHSYSRQEVQLNWLQRRQGSSERYKHGVDPKVLIVGAGHSGLMLAARLKMIGIDTLVVERSKRVGDSWRMRYHSLCLHDPVWANHFPYLPYPESWPTYTPKDKLANWFEHYVDVMELDVWLETTIAPGSKYDEATGHWTVDVRLPGGVPPLRLYPRYFVLATGMTGEPNWPKNFPVDEYAGTLLHSSQFGSGKEWRGKRAVVIGACNSGHDIAADLWQSGAEEVTMAQRSSTYVISSKHGIPTFMKGSFEEGGPKTEDADMMFTGIPIDVIEQGHIEMTKEIAKMDEGLLEGLKKVGFKMDDYPAGLFLKYLRRGGGYYIDVGCSQLISEQKIKLKQGKEILKLTKDGVKFEDGDEIKAHVVICATGYGSVKETISKVVSEEVAHKLGPIWGADSQGEVAGAWRLCGQPGFWFMCGNFVLARCFSKHVASQILLQELKLYDKNWTGRAHEKLCKDVA